MKKLAVSLVATGALALGGVALVATPSQATTTCTYTIGWYKQDASRIGGPDLTASLEAGILAKTGKASLLEVLWAPVQGNANLIAGKQMIAAASNGAPSGGFTGELGHAFYSLANYFEGVTTLTRSQLTTYAGVLDNYNNGLLGVPHCGDSTNDTTPPPA